METRKKPTVTVNTAQEVQKETSNQAIIIDIICLIGTLLFFLLKLVYYNLDSLYYKINPPPPNSVRGEIVLVTGSGHGIGKELALAYASEGATVVGWDINARNNEETIKEIAELGYPKAYAYVCDVSNRLRVLETAKKVQREVGDVTILINNAGIMPCHSLEDHTPEEIRKIFDINVLAHFWTLEAFLPSMKQNNHGHIVCLSSMAGVLGNINLIPYCASKFAVRGLMESLHEELRLNPKNKIKITVVYPYMVDTGLCKRPKIKYESIMPLESPKQVAREILNAQKNRVHEISIPNYLHNLCNLGRLMPFKAGLDLKDSFNAFIDSDL